MNESDANHEEVNRADKSMHQLCKHHMYYHVLAQTSDGQQVEGIITDLDNKNVYMLVTQEMMPADEEQQENQQGGQQRAGQQIGQQGQPQWHGGPRYRKFYRQIFPLAGLADLSLYPYYYPPYPYPLYPYYPYPYPYY
jgi:hypothetical protein